MALTISRKPGEAIVVNGPAVIRIAPEARCSRRVRLQVTAGPETVILREELTSQQQQAQKGQCRETT